MLIALDYFLPQIRTLEQQLGFPILHDDSGNCAIELENALVLGITFSQVDDRYGLHCFLLTAPADHSHATCMEALRLNVELASKEMGVLYYSDEEQGITYTWIGRCSEAYSRLQERLIAASACIQEVHKNLLDVRNAEYARKLAVHDAGFRNA
jgi:hypothetical protein